MMPSKPLMPLVLPPVPSSQARAADLHDAQGGGADGVGEVAAGGRDRTDDGDGADALGVAEDLALARAFVEGCETRA